jgi:hypothetical protein
MPLTMPTIHLSFQVVYFLKEITCSSSDYHVACAGTVTKGI